MRSRKFRSLSILTRPALPGQGRSTDENNSLRTALCMDKASRGRQGRVGTRALAGSGCDDACHCAIVRKEWRAGGGARPFRACLNCCYSAMGRTLILKRGYLDQTSVRRKQT